MIFFSPKKYCNLGMINIWADHIQGTRKLCRCIKLVNEQGILSSTDIQLATSKRAQSCSPREDANLNVVELAHQR